MKRYTFIIILLAVALLLCAGCGREETLPITPPSDEVVERPDDAPEDVPPAAGSEDKTPAPETPEEGGEIPAPPEFSEPSQVYADWSVLEAYEPYAPVGSRLTEEPMTELTPGSGYGTLVPFLGQNLYFAYVDYVAGSLYGLSTREGCVVLDPVCTNIYRAWHYDYYGTDGEALDIYVLSKVTPGLTADEAYEYSDSGELYALAALDGSWATGFDFEGVMSWDGGMAGILNARDNEALLYNEAGQVVLDTRELDWLDQLAEYQLYNLLQGCAVRRTDNSYALIQGGQLLDFAVEVNYCEPFDENGLAVGHFYENDRTLYGYLSAETLDWAIEPVWTGATGFCEGLAGVRRGETACLIDTRGNVVLELGPGWVWLERSAGVFCFTSSADDQTYCYDTGLQLLTLDGAPAQCYLEALYRETEDGLLIQLEDEPFFVPDARYITGVQNGLVYCQFENEARTLVLNSRGKTVLDVPGYVWQTADELTGEFYYQYWDPEAQRQVLLDADGRELPSGTTGVPCGGLLRVTDAVSTGLTDLAGNWVLRIAMDQTD